MSGSTYTIDPRLQQARDKLALWTAIYFITDEGDPRARLILDSIFRAFVFVRILEQLMDLTDGEMTS